MRTPVYLLLPIVGAVVLIAAVLGTWLWPEPAVPAASAAPPVVAAPVAVQPKPPASGPPLQPKPVIRPAPAQNVEPPQQPVAEPMVGAQPPAPEEPPPGPTTSPRMSDWSPEKQTEVKKNWMNIRERAGDLAAASVKIMERQRDEARARGDQAEVERLEQAIRIQRERAEQVRALNATSPAPVGPAAEAQDGPPLQ
jgi:hypothetical protein